MHQQPAIFIFTKDRPATLRKTLNSIQETSYKKYVIDDSISLSNQMETSDLCKKYKAVEYLGKNEFILFLSQHQISLPQFSFLLRELGHDGWNLGYARNFALVVAKSLELDRVLFMDDDIYVGKSELIDELFALLTLYKFSGANIKGLIDDSILGHIATDLGIENERMLSGGFMAFNPNKIEHFFLNNYNEDWIWLFLQLKEKAYLQFGEVYQELSNPLKNYKERVMFQEFGEIALDGILNLYKNGAYNELQKNSFWNGMVQERVEYLDMLIEKGETEQKKDYVEIITWVKSNSANLSPEFFCNLYQNYFLNQIDFLSLYNSLSYKPAISGDFRTVQ